MSSVLNFPGPAAVFPGEPLDDPGVQPGDPGAEPPPVNLEPVPPLTDDPVLQLLTKLTKDATAVADRYVRFSAALNEQLASCAYTCRMMNNAVSRLKPDDLAPSNLLLRELRNELAALNEMLAPMCAEQKPATH